MPEEDDAPELSRETVELFTDPRAIAIFVALCADPRNPHLYPALIDYCNRAEYHVFARVFRDERNRSELTTRLRARSGRPRRRNRRDRVE